LEYFASFNSISDFASQLMSSVSKEQLRARLRLNQRLALSQSSDNRKPPPYFWRLRPLASKRDNAEKTGASEDGKLQATSRSTETNSEPSSELSFHSTKEKEASSEDVQAKLPSVNKAVEVPSNGQGSKQVVEDAQANRKAAPYNQETSFTVGTEWQENDESVKNTKTLEKVQLEQELKRLQEVLVQKDEQIKQKDSEIGYLRQVLGEIATAAHLAVQLESSYSFPAAYYSAEDVKLYRSPDKQFVYPTKRGFHSQPRSESGGTFSMFGHSENDIDAHDTRVSYSNQAVKHSESATNHSMKEGKHRLSLPVDSLGLSGPDTTSGSRHKASALTSGEAGFLHSIPSESDMLQEETQEQYSNDVQIPPSPRLSQLRLTQDVDENIT